MNLHYPALHPVALFAASVACIVFAAGCSNSASPAASGGTSTTASGNGATTSTPVGGSSTTTSGSTTTTSASTIATNCPSVAEMATLVGTTFPAPQVSNSSGFVLCSYNIPSSGANVEIGFASSPGTTASAMQTVANIQAGAQHVTAVAVSGIGDSAYAWTLNDASTNSSGVATSVINVLVGSEIVNVTAALTPAQVAALARYLVAQH